MNTVLYGRTAIVVAAFLILMGLFAIKAISSTHASLPVERIEAIVGIHGSVEKRILELSVSRKDIGDVQGPKERPMTFTPAFGINGDIFFQPLSSGQAFVNGDIPLREKDTEPFIGALLKNGLVFQAFHQHMPTHSQVWFVHFRGAGDPISLAHAVRAALGAANVPLPQSESHSSTPLDSKKLAQILHGHASVGEDGVVTVWVYRRNRVLIGGVQVDPQSNISTNVQFKPTGGSNADTVSDFSMTSQEITPVVHRMLHERGWYQGCLYNQETEERPQLYFDHMLKSGDAYQLAREIRSGLDLTDADGSPHGTGDAGRDGAATAVREHLPRPH